MPPVHCGVIYDRILNITAVISKIRSYITPLFAKFFNIVSIGLHQQIQVQFVVFKLLYYSNLENKVQGPGREKVV
jgi:hypothetical protein